MSSSSGLMRQATEASGGARLGAACVLALLANAAGCSSEATGAEPGPIFQADPASSPAGPAGSMPGPGVPVGPAVAGDDDAAGGPGIGPGPTMDPGQDQPAAAPDAGPDSGGAVDPGPMPDCTAPDWQDSGSVPDPDVTRVAVDAGATGKLWGKSMGIEDYDYLEEEFFFSGSSPSYTSRLVVHRPADPAQFSGTVFVEWYNVTGGVDMGALWALTREYVMREGHVHVGVSAQAVGANALKNYDAERYEAIDHPGDAAAQAIFGQAAMAIRAQTELLLGPCMPVDAVLGVGQSQSSVMLAGYLNEAHPADQIYDGFMLHSAPFGGQPSDPDVPVFVVFTMNEANGSLLDGPNLLEWEVAGASHNDAHLTGRGNAELGSELGLSLECERPLNDFPSFWVYNAALDWLHRWVRDGERPPTAEPIDSGQHDEVGNVLGGVRTPDIDVPIASYTSANASANPLDLISSLGCGLGGSVTPLSSERLLALYPTHEDYVRQYTEAADRALADGFLLQADYDIAIEQAKAAPIPN